MLPPSQCSLSPTAVAVYNNTLLDFAVPLDSASMQLPNLHPFPLHLLHLSHQCLLTPGRHKHMVLLCHCQHVDLSYLLQWRQEARLLPRLRNCGDVSVVYQMH